MSFYDVIPDYLNNALDDATQAEFEAALRTDSALQARVDQERQWLQALREQSPNVLPTMSFASMQQQITARPAFSWIPALPVAAAATALLVITGLLVPATINTGDDDNFHTLSTPPLIHTEDVLRIVVRHPDHVASLVQAYGLEIVQTYPAAFTIDVKANNLSTLQRAALHNDARVKLLQNIEAHAQ